MAGLLRYLGSAFGGVQTSICVRAASYRGKPDAANDLSCFYSIAVIIISKQFQLIFTYCNPFLDAIGSKNENSSDVLPLACPPRGVLPLAALNRFDEPRTASGAADYDKRFSDGRFRLWLTGSAARQQQGPQMPGYASFEIC